MSDPQTLPLAILDPDWQRSIAEMEFISRAPKQHPYQAELGTLVRMMRRESNVLLKELAPFALIGVSQLSKVERGNSQMSWPQFRAVAEQLGYDVSLTVTKRSQ